MSDSQFTNSPEIFKPIPGFPGYEVSDQGRVRSYWKKEGGRHSGTKWSEAVKPKWCITATPQRTLKPTLRLGYPTVTLANDERHSPIGIHRLILFAFVGPCPPGQECRHKDGIPAHCFLDNLHWGTRSDNTYDKFKHGYTCRPPKYEGENHPMAKLTSDQVLKIRELYAHGYRLCELGRMFKVCPQTIKSIIIGKIWNHLP
jgi:hypothetical protein